MVTFKNAICILFYLSFTTEAFAQQGAKPGVVEIEFADDSETNPFQLSEEVMRYQNDKLVAKLRRSYCKKYNKKYIAFYNNIYYVESCKRKALESTGQQFDLTRNSKKIFQVDSEVIAVIPEGDPYLMKGKNKVRSCKELAGKYVTFSDVDVYLVEKCKLRIFADWESYKSHREKKRRNREIIALNWEEFSSIPEGEPMDSVLDKEFAAAQQMEEDVDIIPVSEACKGLNGRYVSYYSRMYKIERCRKRELNPEKFWSKNRGRGSKFKIVELSSEQWVSLPEGKPITL